MSLIKTLMLVPLSGIATSVGLAAGTGVGVALGAQPASVSAVPPAAIPVHFRNSLLLNRFMSILLRIQT